jgi:photosystem II stability/assembly factor-like uncharacterized protein
MRNAYLSVLVKIIFALITAIAFANPSDSLDFWQLQQSNSKANLRGLSIINSKIVWASGSQGTCLKTIDAGNTWTSISIPETQDLDFRDLHAFDENTVCLLSIGEGEKSRIYKTSDSGKTWKLVYKNTNPKAFFDALAFWDEKHGIAFSDPVDGHFLIITTSDGGETWQEIPQKNIPPALDGESAFAASGSCITAFGKTNVWIATGGTQARVFRSTNSGKTWEVSTTPIVSGSSSTGIFSLAFKDTKTGVAVGGDFQNPAERKKTAAYTTDGGKTWQLVKESSKSSISPFPNGYRSSVAYLPTNKNLLLTVGINGTDYSLNGGRSWKPANQEGFNTFACQALECWAIGASGKIAKLDSKNFLQQVTKNKPTKKANK